MSQDSRYYRPQGAAAVHPQAVGQEFLRPPSTDYRLEGGLATIRVQGPLENREPSFSCTYEGIVAAARSAFENPECRAVLLDLETPGGAVSGCFEAARDLRKLSDDHGKPLFAFAQAALSAGYALASAADVIAIPPSGTAGSIGVVEQIVDQTVAMAAQGTRVALVVSGARKGDGHPATPINEDELSAYQTRVDALASEFFALVNEHRGLPVETVAGFGASIYTSQSALNVGLADAILAKSELVALILNNPIETAMKFSAIAKASAAASEAAAAESEEDKPEAPEAAAAESEEDKPEEPEAEGPDYNKAMRAIMSLAENDDDKGEMCRRMLAALKPSAESEEDKPAESSASASAAAPSVDALAEAVAARLEVKAERARLLASAAHLPAEARAALGGMTIEQLRILAPSFQALAASAAPSAPAAPRSSTADARAALTGAAAPTLGGNVGGVQVTNESGAASFLDRAMGLTAGLPSVEHASNISTFRAPRRK